MSTATTLRAFHGDPKVKAKYLRRVRAHRKADQIVKGCYWEAGKGCAVGCTIHSSNHNAYETELGIPSGLAHLEDSIFEGLPNELAMDWPEKFLTAIPVGADLLTALPKFMVWLLTSDDMGLIGIAESAGKDALRQVAGLWQRVADGDEPSVEEWSAAESAARSADSAARSAESAARSAAWSAARSAAWSAARSAAWSAADSAAWSAARSAESAADSAAWSAADSAAWSAAWSAARSAAWSAADSAARSAAWSAESAARSAAWTKISAKLLELLAAA